MAGEVDKEKMVAAMRGNGAIPWGDHHPCMFGGTERFFRPGYCAHLVPEWLPALEGVVPKLEAGATVAVTARTAPALDSVVTELSTKGAEALSTPADLSHESDIVQVAEQTLARFGRIDILVNNAGTVHPRVDLVDFDITMWKQVINVNLVAAALLTKAVLPGMIANRSGKILNISSIGGRRRGKGRSAYRATKAGLISLTESVAAEVKPYGIDAVCICPAGADTEGYREAFGSQGRKENRKLMRPQEIAALAIFLASDASSAITGTAVNAFGGRNPLFA